jgi:pimeloyl-ACP methyl ester carboxylesterase
MTLGNIVAALAIIGCSSSCAGTANPRADAGDTNTYVIVHGAWGGGWAFKALDSLLTSRGHKVYRPTMTGLGERVHLANSDIDLGTHIEDIVNTIRFEELDDVVLVAHSYGGMVASGVAHRIPERLRCVIFFDAFLPEDGESLLAMSRGTAREAFVQQLVASARDGLIAPPGQFDPLTRDASQPVRTLTEPVEMNNPAGHALPGKYILTVLAGTEEADDTFAPYAARARDRDWTVIVMEGDHVPVGAEWEELARLLVDLPR